MCSHHAHLERRNPRAALPCRQAASDQGMTEEQGAPWGLALHRELSGSRAKGSSGNTGTCDCPSNSASATWSQRMQWEARLAARLCQDLTLSTDGFTVAPQALHWSQLCVPRDAPSRRPAAIPTACVEQKTSFISLPARGAVTQN